MSWSQYTSICTCTQSPWHRQCVRTPYAIDITHPITRTVCPAVSCDACGKGGFTGNRYKCLVCYDFDLCTECYISGETGTGRHGTTHPVQCILTKADAGKLIKQLSGHHWTLVGPHVLAVLYIALSCL